MQPVAEHLKLREQLYNALYLYHEAQSAYYQALRLGKPAQKVSTDTRRFGAAVATALAALLDYLERQETDPRIEKEMQFAQWMQDILAHELALLPVSGLEADPA
jgi:hypothetical protein